MTTTTTDTPDGERLARLETRVEHLELQNGEIRADIRDLRTVIRDSFQSLRTEFKQDMDSLRARADKQFLWLLGIVITMWVSIIALGVTALITVLNRLAP